jgi:predicted MPP superfamily phosphohydrolase
MLPGVPYQIVGEILFAIALAVSIYGVLHARRIRVARVDIALSHLPPAWVGKKALFMSDLHLGQINGAKFARKVTTAINTLAPEIVFIGGDLYDGTKAPDARELIAPLKNLKAPLGVYFITGNHEEFGDSSTFIDAIKSIAIRVLSDEVVDIEGLQLAGVDYHSASDAKNFAEILSSLKLDSNKPSILLKHEPKDLVVAQEAGISLQLSGHTHRAQQWPLEYVARLAYGQFFYGLKKFKSMQVYTSSGVGTWGPPLRVGTNSELVLLTFSSTV